MINLHSDFTESQSSEDFLKDTTIIRSKASPGQKPSGQVLTCTEDSIWVTTTVLLRSWHSWEPLENMNKVPMDVLFLFCFHVCTYMCIWVNVSNWVYLRESLESGCYSSWDGISHWLVLANCDGSAGQCSGDQAEEQTQLLIPSTEHYPNGLDLITFLCDFWISKSGPQAHWFLYCASTKLQAVFLPEDSE